MKAIPNPHTIKDDQTRAVTGALKECVDVIVGRTGTIHQRAVTVQDLVDAGIAKVVGVNLVKVSADDTPGFTSLNIRGIGSMASSIYFGPIGEEGSWRILKQDTELVFERMESGTYVEKGSVLA